MKRDGASISIWQKNMPAYTSSAKQFSVNQFYDVVIVGGGITGITTGLLLQKAGKSVLIAEAQNIGFGTTGGTTAHLNTFLDTPYNELIKNFGEENTQLVAKAIHQSMALIKKHVHEYTIDCNYKEVPGYIYAQNEDECKALDEIFEGFKKVGFAVTVNTSIPVPIPFQKAIEIPGQAQFHPTRYIYALAQEFEKLGGVIAENCRVTAVEENEILEISTSSYSVKASYLLYATHIPPGVNILHFRSAPYRSYVIAVELENENDYPEALAYDMQDPYHYYRTQEVDGKKYLIAGGEDHKTAHKENTDHCFRQLEAYVRQFYNIKNIAYRWSSQYFNPTDGLAYIGNLPGHSSNMFVATGYAGIGMTNSHIAARIITDIITKGESEFEKLFHPGRVKPVAGFSNFMKEAADVTSLLIGSLLPKEKLGELVSLAKNEAKVIIYEGHALAIYRDEEGKLHAVNPACTHIKCTVGWNAAEKSWDCPCHGSRFSIDGTMLTAPARKDLEVIDVQRLGSD